jgi:transcription termination/antitermination protein NusG
MPDKEQKGIFQPLPNRRMRQTFRLGDTVRIVAGPFNSFTGKVESINQARSLLKVRVMIFGRA